MQLFGERRPEGRSNGDSRGPRVLEPMGIVDIGSNSVRLVIYDGVIRSPTPIFNEKILCGLGRNVGTTGLLGEEAAARALAALNRFHAIASVLGVKNLRAIATAAVRDAKNGKDFIRAGEKSLGIKIEILSGEQEAKYAAEGIMMGFVHADGIAGDLGGGSLELIDVSAKALNFADTTPLGGLRLMDATGDRIDKAQPLIDDALAKLPWLKRGMGRPIYLVGGTWRSLAKIHMEQTAYPLRVMHGYTIQTRDAVQFCEQLRRAKKVANITGIADVNRARREVIPYGAFVLERLLKVTQPSQVILSVFGIREGLLYSKLSPHERAKDPLFCFAEDYARQRSRSLEHAHELCRWTDAIFALPEYAESADETRLRYAACLMSDIGWRAHPDYRGDQSLNALSHAALSAIDHTGRIFLGFAVYYRHVGPGEEESTDSDRLRPLLTKRALKRAKIVGTAVRAAHMLSIGVAGVIDETPLSFEGNRMVLTLPKSYAGLDGERLRRRFQALAGLLDRTLEIRKPA